jgi:hypothetical protein
MTWRRLGGIAVLCSALSAGAAEFTFGALGDLPYTGGEEQRFVEIIAELNREKLAFVVHVGDIKAATTPCTDEIFLQRGEWFALVRHAFVLVPGDNEWTDCGRLLAGGYDPLERLAKLRELFFQGGASLGQNPLALARQAPLARGAEAYAEHARWEHAGVLFVTLNAPGPDNHSRAMPAEYARRNAAALAWMTEGFAIARRRGLKAVVVAMHANPFTAQGAPRRGFGELVAALAGGTRAFAGEVLLIHGDTHHYRVDRPLRDGLRGAPLANFTRLEVFGSPFVNWVRVKVIEDDARVRFEIAPGS